MSDQESPVSSKVAWRVLLDGKGRPYWVNSNETVHCQPARGGNLRIMDKIFRVVPRAVPIRIAAVCI